MKKLSLILMMVVIGFSSCSICKAIGNKIDTLTALARNYDNLVLVPDFLEALEGLSPEYLAMLSVPGTYEIPVSELLGDIATYEGALSVTVHEDGSYSLSGDIGVSDVSSEYADIIDVEDIVLDGFHFVDEDNISGSISFDGDVVDLAELKKMYDAYQKIEK
ncbi:MAG: hypothetical protein JXR63_05330 [Spirochaetales bacterium]|nr:hypothetical protein [Spirochaetales bacterium]